MERENNAKRTTTTATDLQQQGDEDNTRQRATRRVREGKEGDEND